jgi:arylsulfatase A-like enzyme
MSVDDSIREIFQTMGNLREQRRTLAIFISDNGYLWGEHGLAGKRHPYTPTFSVPFMMRWPGHIRPGSVEKCFALNVDITPTVLDAAGLDPVRRRRIDGRSLLKESWSRPRILLEHGPEPHHERWASIRTRRYQYTEYYAEDGTTIIFREYYRLKRDPWQLRNVLRDGRPGNNPSVAKLHTRLARLRRCKGRACP